MIVEFDKALSDFEQDAYSLIHECHFDPGLELSSFKVQIQAQNLATDIGYLAMVLRDLHQAAISEISIKFDNEITGRNEKSEELMINGFNRHQRPQRQHISIALAKFGAGFKAFMFPVRAYQDAIYMVGLGILGQPIGGKSSMKKAVNTKDGIFITDNPVGQLLASAIPDYATWFASLRGQRNSIKSGAGISYTSGKNFVTGETTIAIEIHTALEKRLSISLHDVSHALKMSTSATKAIVEFGILCGKFNARGKK